MAEVGANGIRVQKNIIGIALHVRLQPNAALADWDTRLDSGFRLCILD